MQKNKSDFNQTESGLRKKIFGWTILIALFAWLGLMIYTLHAPIDLDIPITEILSFMPAVCILALILLFMPIRRWFDTGRLKNKLDQMDAIEFFQTVCTILIGPVLLIVIFCYLLAWIQLRFSSEQVMYAQIIDIRHQRRSCDKWTLLLQNRRSVTVCQTGPDLNWRPGRILKVSVKKNSWAYEVHYLDHLPHLTEIPVQ